MPNQPEVPNTPFNLVVPLAHKANVLRQRGYTINGSITKTYRRASKWHP